MRRGEPQCLFCIGARSQSLDTDKHASYPEVFAASVKEKGLCSMKGDSVKQQPRVKPFISLFTRQTFASTLLERIIFQRRFSQPSVRAHQWASL